ncbi:ABC transporter permease [Lactococcus petauri]|uniref:ABC transporter permease n=1 Tax=Lactococcus petauri TaxID=1940789 RepID=UPI003853D8A7
MLFNLVKKNIKGNLSTYLLYFSSMIVGVVIFYTYSALRYTSEIKTIMDSMGPMSNQTLLVLTIFLIIFISYSNAFFTNKRKKEIGLYSLLGMRKKVIGQMLFLENLILGSFTLFLGVIIGSVFFRGFLMLFMYLVGESGQIQFSISWKAILLTSIIFILLTLFTSLQSFMVVYRFELIELFKAENKGEAVPKSSIFSSFLAITLLILSYWLLFNNMGMVSVPFMIVATYLLFRSVLVLLLKISQKNRRKYYHGINLIRTSQLLYRIKGNALMLSLITLLVTLTLPFLHSSFAEYNSIGKNAKSRAPFSYLYINENSLQDKKVEELITNDIAHPVTNKLEIKVIQASGKTMAPFDDKDNISAHVISEHTYGELQKILNTSEISELKAGQTAAFKDYISLPETDFSNQNIQLSLGDSDISLNLKNLFKESITLIDNNDGMVPLYLVVNNETFKKMEKQVTPTIYTGYQVENERTTQNVSNKISEFYTRKSKKDMVIYSQVYEKEKYFSGMKIFSVSSLSIILLLATGSVLYFKQMTEAYSDKGRYDILRKIGVSRQEVKKTIAQQNFFIFGFPLLMGLINGGVIIFSIVLKYSTTLNEDLVAYVIVSLIYIFVYFIYYKLTIYSYNKVVD